MNYIFFGLYYNRPYVPYPPIVDEDTNLIRQWQKRAAPAAIIKANR